MRIWQTGAPLSAKLATKLAAIPFILLLALMAAPADAQTICDRQLSHLDEIDTRAALKRYVDCAAEHISAVGWEQAAQDFETADWMDGAIFLFAADARAVIHFIAGSGQPAGTDMWELRDSDGHPLAQDMARIAQNFGAGYVYYRFLNRNTGQEEPKLSYVRLLERDGEPAILGAGFHPQDTHATCSPALVRASLVFTERELERFVICAEHHLRQQGLRALREFHTDPRWTAGPTYLFLIEMDTLLRVAHGGNPDLVSVDSGANPDSDGVYFAREFQRVLASHDDGYVYYRRANPANGEIEPKASYIRRALIDGQTYILGAGLYIATPECRALPLARQIQTRAELQQYVRCAARLVAERGELAWDLFLNHPQWIGGSLYPFVNDEQCRQLVYPLGYLREESAENRCDLTDAAGFPASREILATTSSEAGEGWVRYHWLNPESNEVEAKLSFVIGGELGGSHISIGAGLYESQLREP